VSSRCRDKNNDNDDKIGFPLENKHMVSGDFHEQPLAFDLSLLSRCSLVHQGLRSIEQCLVTCDESNTENELIDFSVTEFSLFIMELLFSTTQMS